MKKLKKLPIGIQIFEKIRDKKQKLYHQCMMTKTLIFIILTSLSLEAGDACPVTFDYLNAGVLSWLDKQTVLKDLNFNQAHVGIYTDEYSKQVRITGIKKGTVADIIDLRANDIIEKIDGITLTDDLNVSHIINKKQGGELITFQILRNKKKIIKTFKLGTREKDPLIYKLQTYARTVECSGAGTYRKLNHKEKKLVEKNIFTNLKRFDCQNAHKKLEKLNLDVNEGVVFIRGSKRILISHIGHKTLCIDRKDYLNVAWTDKRIGELFNELFSDYIEYRIQNP